MTLLAIIIGALGTAGISDASEDDDEDLLDLLGEGLSFRFSMEKRGGDPDVFWRVVIYEGEFPLFGEPYLGNEIHYGLGIAIILAIGQALDQTNAWTIEDYRDRAVKRLVAEGHATDIEDAYRMLDKSADDQHPWWRGTHPLRLHLGEHYLRWNEGRLK